MSSIQNLSGKVDTTLFRKEVRNDFIIVQIYVDDIIFGAINDLLCKDFSSLMQSEFEMSMVGELYVFLDLQIKQYDNGIFISQEKFSKSIVKKFG